MFYDEHSPPHFHAEYGEYKALVDIRNLSVFSGRMPPRVTGLVIEWATRYRRKLFSNWERAQAQQELERIPPLE